MVDEATEVVEAELCMVISLLATTCMARKRLRRNGRERERERERDRERQRQRAQSVLNIESGAEKCVIGPST